MVMAVEKESEIRLSVALAVPAVFLNREIGCELICRVVVKAVIQGRIEKPFLSLLITKESPLVMGVGEVLHLKALMFVERGQQETELILKLVKVSNGAVRQVGSLKKKPL